MANGDLELCKEKQGGEQSLRKTSVVDTRACWRAGGGDHTQPASGEGVRGEGEAMALKKSAEQEAGAGQGGAAERRTKDNSQSSRGPKGSQRAKPKPHQATPLTLREAGHPLHGLGLAAHPRTVGRKGDGLIWPSTFHWRPSWRKGRDSPRL